MENRTSTAIFIGFSLTALIVVVLVSVLLAKKNPAIKPGVSKDSAPATTQQDAPEMSTVMPPSQDIIDNSNNILFQVPKDVAANYQNSKIEASFWNTFLPFADQTQIGYGLSQTGAAYSAGATTTAAPTTENTDSNWWDYYMN